ncbi:uncharacterized protein PgNI_00541 [Pyricularia grisea]|uniref:Uncharacterized protein n=1 Tax=Pyricularia grisea TaxID=148305 RepID=A0A6P8BKP1_PYRGI|nr:uncharacterized protein PgNI_00541 [Pyricularia grisea]TLD17363.1 hypothetical protein PgNI_00541 [Pyricularia grisea]
MKRPAAEGLSRRPNPESAPEYLVCHRGRHDQELAGSHGAGLNAHRLERQVTWRVVMGSGRLCVPSAVGVLNANEPELGSGERRKNDSGDGVTSGMFARIASCLGVIKSVASV